jgi:ribonuclease HII
VKKLSWVIGIDEVGRGPLAGAVYVCAVAMPMAAYKKAAGSKAWQGLTDSKKMTEKSRELWYEKAQQLQKDKTIAYAVASRTAAQIDKKGIAVCIRECIKENLETLLKDLALLPADCMVLLDGSLKAPAEYIHQETIIKGDLKEQIISMASVIAKVSRDRYMVLLHKKYPNYGWDTNKGYGTLTHRTAISKKGITTIHRKSFLSRILK